MKSNVIGCCLFTLIFILGWSEQPAANFSSKDIFFDLTQIGNDTEPIQEPKKRPWTSPKPTLPAERGHGLDGSDAEQGWISLFDGKTTFGWNGAGFKKRILTGPGETTSAFIRFELRGEAQGTGSIHIGETEYKVSQGRFHLRVQRNNAARIQLGKGTKLSRLELRPIGLNSVLNRQDFDGWRILKHPRNPMVKAKWSIKDGIARAVGGPGALELRQSYGDFVLQMEVRTATLANGGLFFRAIPGDFMNGYEAQIFNACYDHDPAQPARYSTGAIDDRQMAQRLVSRDGQWFTLTVITQGPHIATWVNGYQQVDWTDLRPLHDNPRKGKRLQPGTIQIQAHDPETDFEFRNIRLLNIGLGKENEANRFKKK